MTIPYKDRLISTGSSIIDALETLNKLGSEPIAFVVNQDQKLIGSLTDGDIRRALLKGIDMHDKVDQIIQQHPAFLLSNQVDIAKIQSYRQRNVMVLPVVDANHCIIDVISLRQQRSYLPINAMIMAGGKGSRLYPLTNNIPKPLLKIQGQSIIDRIIHHLSDYGVQHYWISINYLGDQIKQHIQNHYQLQHISFVQEEQALGTIGSAGLVDDFAHETTLIVNGDILSDVDYEAFYSEFNNSSADMAVLSIPYSISVPYAVLEFDQDRVIGFEEKPSYTYFSSGGVYLIKTKLLKQFVPYNTAFNATDLIQELIANGHKVVSYRHTGYWSDVGSLKDFEQAQSRFA